MNAQRLIVLFVLSICMNIMAFSQDLVPAFHLFSKKKTSYITLQSGKEIECTLRSMEYKKGLVKAVKIKTLDGKKEEIKPEDIKFMYLPPSGYEKFTKTLEVANDATKWSGSDLNSEVMNDGYVYFEQTEVMIKKKKMTLMMQLVNPSFSSKVKIYHDPFANETRSAGIGGIKLVGGIDKSYYVKKGDEVAYRLKKKDYKEQFPELFEDCPNIIRKYGKPIKWSEFAKHIFDYTNDCE